MPSDKRLKRMVQGAELTAQWLDDLGDVLEQGERPDIGAITDFARTLVDYQLPGIARHARRLAESLISNLPIEDSLVAMRLLSKAMQKRDQLSEGTRFELDAAVGVPFKTADLPPDLQESGSWSVLGQQLAEEDRLKVIKTYVFNQDSGNIGLNLAYFPPKTKVETPFRTGTAFHGTGSFYPGIRKSRVALTPESPSVFQLKSGMTIEQMISEFTERLAEIPWLTEIPILLESASLARGDEKLGLMDSTGAVPISDNAAGYRMLAITGNQPLPVFGIWDGSTFELIATGTPKDWRSIL